MYARQAYSSDRNHVKRLHRHFIQSVKTMFYGTYKHRSMVQEAAYSPFCISRAQASRHSKGATKEETEVLESQCSQVSEASIGRKVGLGRPLKVTAEIKQIVDDKMRLDDETTVYQLHQLLTEKGYSINLRTILRCQKALG